jgi:hypothetical protein
MQNLLYAIQDGRPKTKSFGAAVRYSPPPDCNLTLSANFNVTLSNYLKNILEAKILRKRLLGGPPAIYG